MKKQRQSIHKWVYLSELTDVFFVCSFLFSLLFVSGANPVCRPGLANCKVFKALVVRPWINTNNFIFKKFKAFLIKWHISAKRQTLKPNIHFSLFIYGINCALSCLWDISMNKSNGNSNINSQKKAKIISWTGVYP